MREQAGAVNKLRKLKKGDILLIFLVSAVGSFLLGFSYWRTHSAVPGAVVVITNTADHTRHVYPLHRNNEVRVEGIIGESVIEIKDGRARFVSSPCPDKICVHWFGWIENEYQVSFCSPNQILLQIEEGQK